MFMRTCLLIAAAVLIADAVIAAAAVLYRLLYEKRINRALKEGRRVKMTTPRALLIASTIFMIVLTVLFDGWFFINAHVYKGWKIMDSEGWYYTYSDSDFVFSGKTVKNVTERFGEFDVVFADKPHFYAAAYSVDAKKAGFEGAEGKVYLTFVFTRSGEDAELLFRRKYFTVLTDVSDFRAV